jgi:hypothetical protein
MEAVSTSLRGAGRWLVELANPALAGDAYAARACAGMPLVELDHAMVAVAGYAALVAYGVATRPAAKPKAAATGAEAEKAADAAPRAASRGASGGKKSGGGFSAVAALAKLQKEPLMILMLLYNVAQVALCGYMMVEALRVAYANYFPRVICNAHSNTAASKLKDVLWLFYVSKVLDFADTFFIVVRGKWEQFSFLHIYHHFSSEQAEARRASARAGKTPRGRMRMRRMRMQMRGLARSLARLLTRSLARSPAHPTRSPFLGPRARIHSRQSSLRTGSWRTRRLTATFTTRSWPTPSCTSSASTSTVPSRASARARVNVALGSATGG